MPDGYPVNQTRSHSPFMEEQDIALYLRRNPEFFERHQELLQSLRLPSLHGDRAVSLMEKHLELLRERVKQMELHMREMRDNALHNQRLVDTLIGWFVRVVAEPDAWQRPELARQAVSEQFRVTHVALRLWPVAPREGLAWSQPPSDEERVFANGLTKVYCGANQNFSVSRWLDNWQEVKSLAMVPLRAAPQQPLFGLFVLGSPDRERFRENMGSYILDHLASMASATLMPVITAAQAGGDDLETQEASQARAEAQTQIATGLEASESAEALPS